MLSGPRRLAVLLRMAGRVRVYSVLGWDNHTGPDHFERPYLHL